VRKRTGTVDPPEVAHALDFFIWSAMDDAEFRPTEPRPFSDDERHYNAILNRYYGIDVPSTAEQTTFRFEGPIPEGGFDIPRYFPDEYEGTHTVAKDLYVWKRVEHQSRTLESVAKAGEMLTAAPSLPRRDVLVNPDAYILFYTSLQRDGRRFASAAAEERERVALLAMKNCVVPPGSAEGEIREPAGWSAVSYALARQVIADFLDPEALLL
jgi:hypothetical protein